MYFSAGFTVAVEDVVAGDLLEDWPTLVKSRPLNVVVLLPSISTVVARDQARATSGYRDWPVERLYHVFSHETPRVGLWLDTSDDTPDETVDPGRSRILKLNQYPNAFSADRRISNADCDRTRIGQGTAHRRVQALGERMSCNRVCARSERPRNHLTAGAVLDARGGRSMSTDLRNRTSRLLRRIGCASVLVLLLAGPTSAKSTPFFTVEVTPAQPVAGEAISVVVRTWADQAHTVPAGIGAVPGLARLLVLRPAQGNAPDIAIDLQVRALDEFQGTVVAPSAGDWQLVAFPDRTGWASPEVPVGYPDTIALTVRTRGVPSVSDEAVLGLVAVVLIAGVALVQVRRMGRRRGRTDVAS